MIAAPMAQPEVVESRDPGAAVLLDTEGEPLPLAIEAKNVSMWYGSKRAIDNVSLDMPAKAVTAIIGPSGCENRRASARSTACTSWCRTRAAQAACSFTAKISTQT